MSGNNRRQREINRQKQERQATRRAEAAARRRRRQRLIAAVTAFALVAGSVVWALFAFTGLGDSAPVASEATTPAATAPATTTPTSAATTDPAAGEQEDAVEPATSIDCSEPVATRADNITFSGPGQPSDLANAPALLTLTTNCGDIVIETMPKEAPKTVASQIFLAESGFYDAVSCHRLTTAGIFVLQCGDPAGDGTGGPGYTVPDENLPAAGENNYPAGTVAMANAGPDTAGSQFFIVYKDTTLPGSYTIWGHVVEGLDIVRGIAGAGLSGGSSDGPPAQPVVIEKATVSAAG